MSSDDELLIRNSCFPFDNFTQNCCIGYGDGAYCNNNSDCLGLSNCKNNTCQGDSGCGVCTIEYHGKPLNCCVAEFFNQSECIVDGDCVGARVCERGRCAGETLCQRQLPTTGNYVLYDAACICRAGEPCQMQGGVPCGSHCTLNMVSSNMAVCALLPVTVGRGRGITLQ